MILRNKDKHETKLVFSIKKRSRDWLLPVHTVLVVWFFLYIGTILYGGPLVSRFAPFLEPVILVIAFGVVLFLLVNIPLSIYTVVILLKGCASGENKTLLIVFSVLNTLSGLAAWGFLIALMLKP
mgnify:CR=1 FL=1